MKKILIVLFLFVTSCGFKPIYSKDDKLILEFNKIVTDGDERIIRRIINNLGLKEDVSSNYDLLITINYNIEETSKNSKGKVETYRSTLSTKIVVKKYEKTLKNKDLINEFSYSNKDNKFELTKYQNEIKNNLIDEMSREIILFFKLQ